MRPNYDVTITSAKSKGFTYLLDMRLSPVPASRITIGISRVGLNAIDR